KRWSRTAMLVVTAGRSVAPAEGRWLPPRPVKAKTRPTVTARAPIAASWRRPLGILLLILCYTIVVERGERPSKVSWQAVVDRMNGSRNDRRSRRLRPPQGRPLLIAVAVVAGAGAGIGIALAFSTRGSSAPPTPSAAKLRLPAEASW